LSRRRYLATSGRIKRQAQAGAAPAGLMFQRHSGLLGSPMVSSAFERLEADPGQTYSPDRPRALP
jgi:hypothetical protein